jgi:antitoxin HigA-1
MHAPVALQHPPGVPKRQPVHPGRFLERQVLRPLALTQTDAARVLGISRRRVNELVQGQRAMSVDTAVRCALAFGLPADAWLAMQADWDSYATWKTLRRHLPRAAA